MATSTEAKIQELQTKILILAKLVGFLKLISEGPKFHTMIFQVRMCINKCKYIHTREHVNSSMQGNKEDIVNTNILVVLWQLQLRLTMGIS